MNALLYVTTGPAYLTSSLVPTRSRESHIKGKRGPLCFNSQTTLIAMTFIKDRNMNFGSESSSNPDDKRDQALLVISKRVNYTRYPALTIAWSSVTALSYLFEVILR